MRNWNPILSAVVGFALLTACGGGGGTVDDLCGSYCSAEASVCGEGSEASCLDECKADPASEISAGCSDCFDYMACMSGEPAALNCSDGNLAIGGSYLSDACFRSATKCSVCQAGKNEDDPVLDTCLDACSASKTSAAANGSCDEWGGPAETASFDCEMSCFMTFVTLDDCISVAGSCFSCMVDDEYECMDPYHLMPVDSSKCTGACLAFSDCLNNLDSATPTPPPPAECTEGSQVNCTTSCNSLGTRTCGSNGVQGSCIPPEETCNGKDDDCNGDIDDGINCAE
jgi:hypothetical protein